MKTTIAFLLLTFAVPAFARNHHVTFDESCVKLSQKWLNQTGWKHFLLSQPNPKNAMILQVTWQPNDLKGMFDPFSRSAFHGQVARGVLSLASKGSNCVVTNQGGAAKGYLADRAHQAHVKVR